MSIRDPRSREFGEHPRPAAQVEGRDPTQSLSLPPESAELEDDDLESVDPSHPSLAIGTHDADERTKVESPAGARKTPAVAVQRLSSKPSKASRSSVHASDNLDDHVGSILGNYKVCELLGKGGMGYVYRAEHVKLGREVAIKLLRNDYARRRDAVARFIQEARTVNRIRHRNIVDVPDIVELDDGTTFIVMEFLRGQSLGKWARSGVDLPRALAVLVQICDGLGAAHAVGIVHRDLKPDNVIVVPTSDGAELVKLLDFGVAKLLNRDDEDIGFQTAAGSVIGTPAYMSPEQAGGMVIDARSDIYSLGAIMYELFCGQPMFRGRSFGEYVRKHLTEQPIRPRATQGGAQLDERLEAIILKALEKDPAQRFGHILELRDALLHMLGGMETHPPGFAAISGIRNMGTLPPIPHVPTPISQASAVMMSPSMFYSQHSQLAPVPAPATPLWVWLVGGAVAVSIGIAGALWYANRTDAVPAAAAPVVVQAPIAVPIAPVAPPAAKILTLRFDSLPSGGVFAAGRSAELCRTPCAFNIDLNDGGAADKRVFVVRSEGFKDADVAVDLTGTQRAFNVTLDRVVAEVIKPIDPKKPARPGHPAKPVIDKKPPVIPETPITPPDPEVTKKPPVTPTPDKKPPKPIDPTETLDPFHRKP